MSGKGIVGLVTGIAAGAAAVVAGYFTAAKVVGEIKDDFQETTFVSPNEKNIVTVKCGASKFAKGLTYIKVKAENENENCEMGFLAGKGAYQIDIDWVDENTFELSFNEGKHEKTCVVSFTDEQIDMKYYTAKQDTAEEEIAE